MADDQRLEPGWADAVAYANSYKTMDPAVNATGLRTHDLRYRTLSHSNDQRTAEEFLANTRLPRRSWASESSIASYFSDAAILMLSVRRRGGSGADGDLALPPPVPLSMRLGDALAERRSRRLYTGDPLPLNYLATLLRAAGGITGTAEAGLASGGKATLQFRTTASAGGLYPIDIFLLALKVTNLPKGLYLYDPFVSRLQLAGDDRDVERALAAFVVPDDMISLSRATVVFFLVAQPWRSMRKYGARGMRFVFMEAGAIAQNLNLAAVALGFGSVECASTVDDEIHDALQLDGTYRSLVHSVVVGYAG